MSKKSSFSKTCNYQVTSHPFRPRAPGHLSERDKVILTMTETFGAVSFFQLQQLWPHQHRNKTRNAAKALGRCGILAIHRLECEEYRMNICTPGKFPGLDSVLRSMAFFQLYLRLREAVPGLNACLASSPLTGVILMNNKEFPVVVVRSGDNTVLLPYQVQQLPRLVIVSETFEPVFKKVTCDCRVALDNDLLDMSLPLDEMFYNTSGIKINAHAQTGS
jgi:hypothetical protein